MQRQEVPPGGHLKYTHTYFLTEEGLASLDWRKEWKFHLANVTPGDFKVHGSHFIQIHPNVSTPNFIDQNNFFFNDSLLLYRVAIRLFFPPVLILHLGTVEFPF